MDIIEEYMLEQTCSVLEEAALHQPLQWDMGQNPFRIAFPPGN